MTKPRLRWSDGYARAFPPRLLRLLALPLGRHLNSADGHRWEATRMLNDAFNYVQQEGVDGDYAEFGVFEGRLVTAAWEAIQRYGLNQVSMHAYDSFEGLPSARGADEGGPFRGGQFRSPRHVFDAETRKIPAERLTVTEGFFDVSLPQADQHSIAVAWVDCDLYESTVPVLDFLTTQLQDGSVLVFDDWFCFHGRPDRGEHRACREWLEANPHISLVPYRDFHWAGRSFLVNIDQQ
jgi:O-methyltransferase